MWVHVHMNLHVGAEEARREHETPWVALQAVGSCHVGAGDYTMVLCKGNKCSEPLSIPLSFDHILFTQHFTCACCGHDSSVPTTPWCTADAVILQFKWRAKISPPFTLACPWIVSNMPVRTTAAAELQFLFYQEEDWGNELKSLLLTGWTRFCLLHFYPDDSRVTYTLPF